MLFCVEAWQTGVLKNLVLAGCGDLDHENIVNHAFALDQHSFLILGPNQRCSAHFFSPTDFPYESAVLRVVFRATQQAMLHVSRFKFKLSQADALSPAEYSSRGAHENCVLSLSAASP